MNALRRRLHTARRASAASCRCRRITTGKPMPSTGLPSAEPRTTPTRAARRISAPARRSGSAAGRRRTCRPTRRAGRGIARCSMRTCRSATSSCRAPGSMKASATFPSAETRYSTRSNVAVTLRAWSRVTAQVGLAPAQAPLQPAKAEDGAGAAVSLWRKASARRGNALRGKASMAKTSPGEFIRQVRAEAGKVVWPSRHFSARGVRHPAALRCRA